MNTETRRCVLEGVPRVHFYEGGPACPEDLPLASIFRALMEYFGESDFGCAACRGLEPHCSIRCSYAHFVGVTGIASYLSWREGWCDDNVSLEHMPGSPESSGFRAAGYCFERINRRSSSGEEAMFRARVRQSLQQGRPLIAYGVVGPPEPALISGYDDDGDVLIGWSFFQNMPQFSKGIEFESSGYFRKRHWYETTRALVLIGERRERLPFGKVYRDALKRLLHVAKSTVPGRANGIAAYDAWAQQLLPEELFPADEAEWRRRHEIHNGAVGTVAEARWYGAQFLTQASEPSILHHDAAEHLLHAAGCYAAEHRLMWELWDLAGGNGNPDAPARFADPSVRRAMVPLILKARDKEAEALAHIGRALEALESAKQPAYFGP